MLTPEPSEISRVLTQQNLSLDRCEQERDALCAKVAALEEAGDGLATFKSWEEYIEAQKRWREVRGA